MKTVSFEERKCTTVPVMTNNCRLLQWKPSWAMVTFLRSINEKKSITKATNVTIENVSMENIFGYSSSIIISGHFVLPERLAMAKLLDEFSTSDSMAADFIETSIISVFNQYVEAFYTNHADPIKYGSMISRIQEFWKIEFDKFSNIKRGKEKFPNASKDTLLNELDHAYSTLATLVNSRNLHLWSRPLPPTGEGNPGRLFVSEALLFGHLLEALLYDDIYKIIESKYSVLKEFYDNVLKTYFIDFSTANPEMSLRWQDENRVMLANKFVMNNPKYDNLVEHLYSPKLPPGVNTITKSSRVLTVDNRYELKDESTSLKRISISSSNSLNVLKTILSQPNQAIDATDTCTKVSVSGILFTALMFTNFAYYAYQYTM